MSPNLALVIIAGVLVAAGVYLLLERSLTRILVGVLLASNGVNVLFLVVSGAAGGAPIIGITPKQDMSDPLPQAMVLTAIVITLGVTAYLLALAYRSFQLNGHDEVADDVEDAAIRRLADEDLASDSYDEADEGAAGRGRCRDRRPGGGTRATPTRTTRGEQAAVSSRSGR